MVEWSKSILAFQFIYPTTIVYCKYDYRINVLVFVNIEDEIIECAVFYFRGELGLWKTIRVQQYSSNGCRKYIVCVYYNCSARVLTKK